MYESIQDPHHHQTDVKFDQNFFLIFFFKVRSIHDLFFYHLFFHFMLHFVSSLSREFLFLVTFHFVYR